ncbi:hypothetical protein NM962_14605 [Mycobacterium sp. SVM_VP21]|nr:hypothetical protein NM962_14605 [Mycobacterium sp. SVM_VP21]
MIEAMTPSPWLAITCSALSLVTSVAAFYVAYQRGKYSLTITSETTAVTINGKDQEVIAVEALNDGGVPAQVTNVILADANNSGTANRLSMGSPVPVSLAANGGSGIWYFDHIEFRRRLPNLLSDTPLKLKAYIAVGSKTHPQRRALLLPAKGGPVSTKRLPIRDRIRELWQGLIAPQVSVQEIKSPDSETISSMEYSLLIQTIDKGWLDMYGGATLALFVVTPDGELERVEDITPIAVSFGFFRRMKQVKVPIIDDSSAKLGDRFRWVLRSDKGRILGGTAARTLSEVNST